MPALAPKITGKKRPRNERKDRKDDKHKKSGSKRDGSKLREANATLKAMVERLQDELDRVNGVNGIYRQKQKALERRNAQMHAMNASLNAENERLMRQVVRYQDKHREAQRKVAELQNKVKELELQSVNVSEFMEWNWQQILFWIMAVDKGRFQKYELVLKEALSEAEMVGEDLLSVNPFVIKMWGVKDRKDRERMNGHIQDLLQLQRTRRTPSASTSKENEGVPASPTTL